MEYRISRKAFISNYIFAIIAILTLILFLPYLTPEKIFSNFLHYIFFFGFIGIAIFLIQQPEWSRVTCLYIIDKEGITKIEGLIRKKRTTIPYRNITGVKLKKGIIGRILNFGNIEITSGREKLILKGISNPDQIYKRIKSKSGTSEYLRVREGKEETKEEPKQKFFFW